MISENWDCNRFQIKLEYFYECKMKIARNKPLFLELLSFQFKWPFCGNRNGRSLPRISPFLREADEFMNCLYYATVILFVQSCINRNKLLQSNLQCHEFRIFFHFHRKHIDKSFDIFILKYIHICKINLILISYKVIMNCNAQFYLC